MAVNPLEGCTTLEEATICNDNYIHKVTVNYVGEYTQPAFHHLLS